VKLLREERPGSYNARNLGISAASGEVLAFTDSDCLPDSHWLEAGVACLVSHPKCGFVGGAIDVFAAGARPSAPELYEMLFAFQQETCVKWESYAATANMLTTRKVMDLCGPFDGSLRSGGDNEWGRRVSSRGFKGVYSPQAVVRHPARRSYAELARKTRRLAGGRLEQLRRLGRAQFASGVARTFLPPCLRLRAVLTDKRIPNRRDRLRLVWVSLFVWVVRSMETVHLVAGGTSPR
jgi:glycosyltransferase involved in cell wall biosynthesis